MCRVHYTVGIVVRVSHDGVHGTPVLPLPGSILKRDLVSIYVDIF